MEDRSRLSLAATAPEGASFDYMSTFMDNLIQVLDDSLGSEKDAIISVTSPGFGASSSVNSGFGAIILTDPNKRDKSQQQIADDIN